MLNNDKQIQEYVDRICSLGCTHVRQVMAELEAGREMLEYASLALPQRRQLLQELHSIMSVYTDR